MKSRLGITLLAVLGLIWPALSPARAQDTNAAGTGQTRHVLLIFSESRDLPGIVMMEQAIRAEMLKDSTNRIEFYAESLDAARFPNSSHFHLFCNYLQSKYQSQNLDLAVMFMGRDFMLGQELPALLGSNVPSLFVVVNDLNLPQQDKNHPFTGVFQRFDIPGTFNFIFRLQPETHQVVVVGGTSVADRVVLGRIAETTSKLRKVDFEFWTNRPMTEVYQAAKSLPEGTVILTASVQCDVNGEPLYTSTVARNLAANAPVPVYVLGAGSVGTGVLGGNVVDLDNLGENAGRLGMRVLSGTPAGEVPFEIHSNGVPTVDWRAMQRWHIKFSRLPSNCVIRFRPQTLWETHGELIIFVGFGFLAQAITIAALLVQRQRQRYAEAEILKQRTELAHVARVSMLGQLATALTHELNQPLGAILRNAEAAEIYLQGEQPNLNEVRAILTDIRRDDRRAGNVIDRMRSLFKRQKLTSDTLDIRDLVEDTVTMARPDAAARHVKLRVEIPAHLPPAQGDRVHVQQVLLNLIFNGMDAMNSIPRTRRLLVITADKTRNGNLQVKVADTGTGVTPDDAEHIFEPFFTTKSNGMGMGLAISRTIIEAHGGEIWLTSKGMEGTTFTFILPQAGFDKVRPGDLPAQS